MKKHRYGKVLAAILLAACLCLTASACGRNSAGEDSPVSITAEQTVQVAVGQPLALRAGTPGAVSLNVQVENEAASVFITRVTLDGKELPVEERCESYTFDRPGAAEVTITAADETGTAQAVVRVTVVEEFTAEDALRSMEDYCRSRGYLAGTLSLTVEHRDGEGAVAPSRGETSFETARENSAVHLTTTLREKEQTASMESYSYRSGKTGRLLSNRSGGWGSFDLPADAPLSAMESVTGLLTLPRYEKMERDGDGRQLLTGTLDAKALERLVAELGTLGELIGKDELKDQTGTAALSLEEGTCAPASMTVTAQTGEDIPVTVTLLFAKWEESGTVQIPEKEIEAAILAAEENEKKAAEQAEKDREEYEKNRIWVDVDLTAQYIYLYKGDEVILSSPCVSGCIEKGWETPTGRYYVYYKTTGAYLIGDAYVDYWIPFNGGIGFHDASWRGGYFSSDQAWSNGSHGCINLPFSAAKTLYQYLSAGDLVVVHGWPRQVHEHTLGEWVVEKEATCAEPGRRYRECTDCLKVVEEETLPKLPHTEGEWEVVTAATANEDGLRQIRCTVCGQVVRTEVIPRTHNHVASGVWETVTEPTCTAEGLRVQRCKDDDAVVLSEAIPALDHDWGAWVTDSEPTCEGAGRQSRTCNRCGEREEQSIPPTGHSWGEWVTVTEPTETEEGLRCRTCATCGAQQTEAIPPVGAGANALRRRETREEC